MSNFSGINLPRTQEIGAAVEFLGCDGLIAPCARWHRDNLMLFPDRMGADATLEAVTGETVDWIAWPLNTVCCHLRRPRVFWAGTVYRAPRMLSPS